MFSFALLPLFFFNSFLVFNFGLFSVVFPCLSYCLFFVFSDVYCAVFFSFFLFIFVQLFALFLFLLCLSLLPEINEEGER